MNTLSRFAIPAAIFVLTLVFGFWLSHSGRPYNGPLFNIHKLAALAAVIVTAVQLSRMLGNADSPSLLIILLVLAALCVVALFASGALMSAGKLDYALMRAIHRVAPVVMVIALALVAYLLAGRKPN
jgi:hypothetical protein